MFCFRNLFSEETTCFFRNDDIKEFKKLWNPEKGSSLWVLPGHILYTTSDGCQLLSCDARPLDAPNRKQAEISTVEYPIVEVLTVNNDKPVIFVVIKNGEVQIYEYKILLYHWEKIGCFNLIVKSDDSSNPGYSVRSIQNAYFHQSHIYWCEKDLTSPSESCFKFCRIKIPTMNFYELSDEKMESGILLMNNCPELRLASLLGGLFIWPNLPYNIHIYIVWNSTNLRLFDINGKCIWRTTTKTNNPIDFLGVMAKVVGLWSEAASCVKLCATLSTEFENVYLYVGGTIISFTSSGEIDKKIDLHTFSPDVAVECCIHKELVYVATGSTMNLHSLKDGRHLQELNLVQYGPMCGLWHTTFFLPLIGFYTNSTVYQLHLKSLSEIFSLDVSCYNEILSYFTQGHLHFLALLKDLISEHSSDSDKLPLSKIPDRLQSRALMLAVIQFCREKNIASYNFPFTEDCLAHLLSVDMSTDFYAETKLKQLLHPLVECFLHIEKGKINVIRGDVFKPDTLKSSV